MVSLEDHNINMSVLYSSKQLYVCFMYLYHLHGQFILITGYKDYISNVDRIWHMTTLHQ